MKWSIVILSGWLLMFGCTREDRSDCPLPVNTELTFIYEGDTEDPAMFDRQIDRVAMYVFDSDGDHVLTRVIDKSDLRVFQGTRLYLAPGNYSIICWGNSFADTECAGIARLSDGRVNHPNFSRGERIPTGDHLYYARHNIVVPSEGVATGGLRFEGAHIDMKIYVRYNLSSTPPDQWPSLEIHNLMPQYDMRKNAAKPFSASYYPVMGYDSERSLNTAFFQVFLFEDINPIKIEVKKSTGESAVTVALDEYMASNEITVNGRNEAIVPILIEISDLGVIVSVPEWEISSVLPEI